MKGFLKDIYLRPSCYQCLDKGINRLSDITLADFWGIEHIKPEIFADRGISAVLIHSIYGEKIWEDKIPSGEVASGMMIEEVEPESVIQYNLNMISSVKKPKERDYFFQKSDIKITKRIKKYTKTKKIRKIKNFTWSVIKRLKNILSREK